MKFKTTTKAIRNGCINIRCASYCEAYYLLKNHAPIAYTCGTYGWNYDVYEVYGLTICTGYRGMPGTRLEGVTALEKQARTILEDWKLTWDERSARIEELLKELCVKNGGCC